MISHVNVISHVLMVATFESATRRKDQRDVILGLLPQSHIYGLVVICHDGVFRGDSIVVLPKFELITLLESIQRFKINALILVRLSIPHSESRLDMFLTHVVCLGPTYRHRHDQQQGHSGQIRPQQRERDLQRRCSSWPRDGKSAPGATPVVGHTRNIWYADNPVKDNPD
jgi:acyl-CoA synthetase (AMP-forming)/AMP-acid ligase II